MDWSWLPPLVTVAGSLGGVALGDRLRGRSEDRGRRAEDERRFHDERRVLYAAWLAHLDALESLEKQGEENTEDRATSDWGDRLAELSNNWVQEGSKLRSQIALVGNQAVMDSLGEATKAGVTYLWRYASLPTDGSELSIDDLREYQQRSEDFSRAFLACVNAMRSHIGQDALEREVVKRGGALSAIRIVEDL